MWQHLWAAVRQFDRVSALPLDADRRLVPVWDRGDVRKRRV